MWHVKPRWAPTCCTGEATDWWLKTSLRWVQSTDFCADLKQKVLVIENKISLVFVLVTFFFLPRGEKEWGDIGVMVSCEKSPGDQQAVQNVSFYWSDGQTSVQRHSGNRQWHTSLYSVFTLKRSNTFRTGRNNQKVTCWRESTLHKQYLLLCWLMGIQFLFILWGRYCNIHAMNYTSIHTTDGTGVTTYHHLLYLSQTKWQHDHMVLWFWCQPPL